MSAFCLSPSSSFSLSVLGLALSYKYTILKQNPKSSLNPRSFLSCILRHTFFFFWPLLTQMSQKETFLFSASFTASVLSPWQQCLFSFFFLCCMSSVMSNSSVTPPLDCSPPGSSVHGISQVALSKCLPNLLLYPHNSTRKALSKVTVRMPNPVSI